ncbi:hypothetical protein [Candidatus Halocynthiibacter alkanivorans]|uniref:hypothetical protein n=1 Tax=Candidatus Halocynthiibacter alkanivorans TaxID=2267619 RepID=UPI000DF3BAEB|nr:hypothetical protein [Candidatus Halocynthiibacter alkanivorans]
MAFKLRHFAILSLVVLAACSQTITSSSIKIKDEALSERRIAEIEEKLTRRAEALGGSCELRSEIRQYYVCVIDDKAAGTILDFGYSREGEYFIIVFTTVGHWMPPQDDDVKAGKHITMMHSELENWLVATIPPEIIESKTRSFVGYDYRENF